MTSAFVADIEEFAETEWNNLKGSKAATIVKNVYNSTIAEMESIAPAQVEAAVEAIGVAALGGLHNCEVFGRWWKHDHEVHLGIVYKLLRVAISMGDAERLCNVACFIQTSARNGNDLVFR